MFGKPKFLEFDDECQMAFALARVFAGHNKRPKAQAVDILRGMLHSGQPESVKFATKMNFGYSDEISALKALGSPARSKLSAGVEVSDSLKKILARANLKAQKEKASKIGFKHLLYGLIEERPPDVSHDLNTVGKAWDDLKEYENGA